MRYDLLQYNTNETIRLMDIEEHVHGTFHSVAGVTQFITFTQELAAGVSSRVTLHMDIPFESRLLARVFSKIEWHIGLLIFDAVAAGISSKVHVAKVMNFAELAEAEIKVWAHLGKHIFMVQDISGKVSGSQHVGKLMPIDDYASAFIDGLVSAGIVEYHHFMVNVTIPARGELIINSDTFTAFLNRANVIHAYSGDWIMLVRDTTKLQIGAGSGGRITGEVLFDERFL